MNIGHMIEARFDIWHDGHFSNFTQLHPLWSYNVAHSCDHATFNVRVDCCCGILQQLLRICMLTKGSVTFQAIQYKYGYTLSLNSVLNCTEWPRTFTAQFYPRTSLVTDRLLYSP
jgi:hypothetical protein